MLLEGKNIIVFAGITGTGKACAKAAIREGAAKVVTISRADPTDERAVKAVEEIRSYGKGLVKHIKCDASKREEVDAAIKEAADFFGGRIDGLSLGQAVDHHGFVYEIDNDLYQQDLDVAFFGTINAVRAAFPYMKDNGGSIVTYGADATSNGLAQYGPYNAAKGAVIMASRSIATELAPYNIRVNCIAPVVYTEISDAYRAVCTPEQEAISLETLKEIKLGGPEIKGWDRMGDAIECGNLSVFLMSDLGKFITGQYINVDGGAVFGRM